QEFLDRAQVIAGFEQMRRETMSESMTASVLGDARALDGRLDCALQTIFEYMMPANHARAWILGTVRCWEYVLPAPRCCRGGIFSFQRIRQLDRAVAFSEILGVQTLDADQMVLERGDEAAWHYRHAIFGTLTGANGDLLVGEIQVFDP